MTLYNRIIAWLFSLVLMIFPSLERYSPPLDWETAALVVLEAIETRDIDTIEAFMCKNIKDNYPNLHDDIGKFIDTIEGEIVSLSKSASNGSGSYSSSGGKTVEQKHSAWYIETAKNTYALVIHWEIYNNYEFEERGIRSMGLSVKVDYGYGWEGCGESISAT